MTWFVFGGSKLYATRRGASARSTMLTWWRCWRSTRRLPRRKRASGSSGRNARWLCAGRSHEVGRSAHRRSRLDDTASSEAV